MSEILQYLTRRGLGRPFSWPSLVSFLFAFLMHNKEMKQKHVYWLILLISLSCTHQKKGAILFTDSVQSENTDFYEMDVSLPVFSCASAESCHSDEINRLITDKLSPYLKRFQGEELEKKQKFLTEQKDFTEERKFTLNIHHETIQSRLFISAIFTVEIYELGAHGNQLFETFVYDHENNKELKFQDFISGDLLVLNQLLTEVLNQKDSCFDRNVSIESDFDDFSLTENEMLFHFAPYELGAYVCGPVSLSLTFEKLKAHKLWAFSL